MRNLAAMGAALDAPISDVFQSFAEQLETFFAWVRDNWLGEWQATNR